MISFHKTSGCFGINCGSLTVEAKHPEVLQNDHGLLKQNFDNNDGCESQLSNIM